MSKNSRSRQAYNQHSKTKPPYKGPFQENPNLQLQNVKKSMRPEMEGPTVNTFSSLDSTTNVLPNEENDSRQISSSKRPTKEKKFSISFENIVLIIIGIVATGVGIIVYTHSNKFVAVEKDIDYLKEDSKEHGEMIHNIEDKANIIDRKVDLLNQKIDYKIEKVLDK